jgi:hypothetical protein
MSSSSTCPATAPTAAHRARFSWRDLGRHAVQNVAFNTLIAVVLWAASRHNHFDVQWVYSQAIGLSVWLLIDGGRFLVDPASPVGWPRGWKGLALAAFGIVAGCLIGTALGDAYSGRSSWAAALVDTRSASIVFLITLVIGGVVSYHYYVRGQSAFFQAQLELTQRQATEAQLKLLQTQLEPHMLFNTLATLRVLIGVDPERAQAMLDHMVAYLRATLGASRASMHPLADEFDRLRDYLALMEVRMGPRLRFNLDLPEALRDVPVPPLLLQPLVENSIKHGLEPQVAGGDISVCARQQGGQLLLEVRDSGVGCNATTHQPGSGFGMTQVRERLATAYGQQATIIFIANNDRGMRTQITFPLKNA